MEGKFEIEKCRAYRWFRGELGLGDSHGRTEDMRGSDGDGKKEGRRKKERKKEEEEESFGRFHTLWGHKILSRGIKQKNSKRLKTCNQKGLKRD
jgi:hypothetical protein